MIVQLQRYPGDFVSREVSNEQIMDSYERRKRTRYCPHCNEHVSYLVYKRHKEEFYDIRTKEWNTHHSDLYQEMDAVDDENICNALASSHKGPVFCCFLSDVIDNSALKQFV